MLPALTTISMTISSAKSKFQKLLQQMKCRRDSFHLLRMLIFDNLRLRFRSKYVKDRDSK